MAKRIEFGLGVVGLVSVVLAAHALTGPEQMPPRDRSEAAQRASDLAAFERKAAELEAAAARLPSNAQGHHLIGALYLDKSRDPLLTSDQKRAYIARGVAAEDRALAANPRYVEAKIYKNLLLRTESALEADPVRRAELVREADALRSGALELQGSREAPSIPEGTVVIPGPPPPPPPPPGGVSGDIQWTYGKTAGPTLVSGTRLPTLVKRVQPVNAPMVIASGIQGDVEVEATIEAQGTVSRVRIVKSLPMLTQATYDAVRQWEFDPQTVPAGGAVISVTASFVPPPR